MARKVQARNIQEGDRILVNGKWVTVEVAGTYTHINFLTDDQDHPGLTIREQMVLDPASKVLRDRTKK